MALEDLVKEWRDAREDWFNYQHWGHTKWKNMPMDQEDIIRRMSNAENALMAYARKMT